MSTTKRVRISTITVGQHFGTAGVVRYRNGRIASIGETRPYGFTAAALEDAERIAERNGWTIDR